MQDFRVPGQYETAGREGGREGRTEGREGGRGGREEGSDELTSPMRWLLGCRYSLAYIVRGLGRNKTRPALDLPMTSSGMPRQLSRVSFVIQERRLRNHVMAFGSSQFVTALPSSNLEQPTVHMARFERPEPSTTSMLSAIK